MFSGGEGIPLFYDHFLFFQVEIKELVDHGKRLGVPDQLHIRITQEQLLDHGTVVGLHMVYDEIVQGAAIQDCLDILKELAAYRIVRGVEEYSLLVHQKVGVVGDPVRERENVFK